MSCSPARARPFRSARRHSPRVISSSRKAPRRCFSRTARLARVGRRRQRVYRSDCRPAAGAARLLRSRRRRRDQGATRSRHRVQSGDRARSRTGRAAGGDDPMRGDGALRQERLRRDDRLRARRARRDRARTPHHLRLSRLARLVYRHDDAQQGRARRSRQARRIACPINDLDAVHAVFKKYPGRGGRAHPGADECRRAEAAAICRS